MPADTATPSALRRFAVLSQIGDALTLVGFRPTVGSRLDQNRHETVAVPGAEYDRVALLAAQAALRRADPAAVVALLELPAPSTDAPAPALLDGDTFTPTETLSAALAREQATHLLLITKLRDEANLRTDRGGLGSGKLVGLGFYVDRQTRLKRSDTGETGIGFLAPFAYFKVSLIDLSGASPVRQHFVRATTTFSAARNAEGFDPWNAISPEQKVNVLRGFIRRELAQAVPALLKP